VLVSFKCPSCNNRMYEDHSAVGQIRQCPRCLHCVQVPQKHAPSDWNLRWVIVGLLLCAIVAAVYWAYHSIAHAS